MREATLVQERNNNIRAEFLQLYKGKRLQTDACLEKLEKKYYLKAATIRQIIKGSITQKAAI